LLEEQGLESTLDWYIPTIERQTGITIHYEKTGTSFAVETGPGVQIYRIVQEALNNVVRHAVVQEAWVRLNFLPDKLKVSIEDHGKGFVRESGQRGIGLVAMRERAEIIGGTLTVEAGASSGTIVQVEIPRERVEAQVG